MATACGAETLAAWTRTELYAAGARPRTTAVTGPESLTASERRVAALAAEGRTNREAAEALFVTPKTVEMHLGNIYRKLGISARKDRICRRRWPARHAAVGGHRRPLQQPTHRPEDAVGNDGGLYRVVPVVPGVRRAHHGLMAAPQIRIVLELEPDRESLTGRAVRDGHPARQFTGWLGLLAALQALLPEQGVDEQLSPPTSGGAVPDGTGFEWPADE